MPRKKKEKAQPKIEILDDMFDPTGEVVVSGNVRATFPNGTMIDIYVADDFNGLFVDSKCRSGHREGLVIRPGKGGSDLVVQVQEIK